MNKTHTTNAQEKQIEIVRDFLRKHALGDLDGSNLGPVGLQLQLSALFEFVLDNCVLKEDGDN